MKKSRIKDLEYLTDKEKEALIELQKETQKNDLRLILIGSKARGDFNEKSDIDIVVLFNADRFTDGDAEDIMLLAYQLSDKIGANISTMILSEEIEYCDEDEAKAEFGAYSWVPIAIEKDGIVLLKHREDKE